MSPIPMASRSSISRLCSILLLLNAAASLYAAPFSTEGSGIDCSCPEGFWCDGNSCVSNCDLECSNEAYSPLCATNGETYNNMCEFERQKCIQEQNWQIIYMDKCVTLPPPPENLCKQHQERIANMPGHQYQQICGDVVEKYLDGTLLLNDLTKCYEPRCNGDQYEIRQCSYNIPGYCWCSDPTGLAIEGTLKLGLTVDECYQRQSCTYENKEYNDGSLFLHDSGCGFCECLDGEVTCFSDYIPDVDKELSDEQIIKLKEELVQLYIFQWNHQDHVLIDIRHIKQHPTTVTVPLKKMVLEWKFDYYDRDGNDGLTAGEQYLSREEIHSFLSCSSFYDHIIELIDENEDREIDITEWGNFFEVDIQPEISGSSFPVKRNADDFGSSQHEKKRRFFYTLI